MPDLKSELQKLEALKFDDEGTTQQEITMHEPTTTGVSATFFNIIKDNPGCTRSRLVAMGQKANVAKASSSSLLGQFVKRGLIRCEDSRDGLIYFCVGSQYKPGYVKQAKKADKVASPKVVSLPQRQDVSVQELLNTMPIAKARALYDELRKIFGA